MINNPENYTSLFEIGIMDNGNPAVKAFTGVCSSVCPITLAAMTTALFETVMLNVEENKQIHYEQTFTKAFKKLMKERHNLEIIKTIVDSDNPQDES